MTDHIKPDILHLEACNFLDKPMGGQLTFSRQLMKVLGNRLALVGWASDPSEPVGSWFDKEIEGTIYRYFAICPETSSARKPIIPARLSTYFQIKRHIPQILSIGIKNIIVEEHTILMAMDLGAVTYNLCYCFPGVEAPLSISRYPFVKVLAEKFDSSFFNALQKTTSCVLAAADQLAIDGLYTRAGERMKGIKVTSFPTRVDTSLFHPAERVTVRHKLGLPDDAIIAVTTGRIHWAKGWPFLLDSFKLFHNQFPSSVLVYLGDGAERGLLEQKIIEAGLKQSVIVAGYQSPTAIATYLQAADLFVMGSFKEGWSTVLVEALACHVPTVTTRFSSADTIVQQGKNGFVMDDRDPHTFSKAMVDALKLKDVAGYADSVIDNYALDNLARDLFKVWPLI